MNQTKKIILCIVAAVLGIALLAGGVTLGIYLNRPYINQERSIAFRSPDLTGRDAVIVPASGVTRRNVTAVVYDNEMTELEENPVHYRLHQQVEGITLEDNMLTVSSEVKKSVTVKVTAEDAADGVQDPVHRTLTIRIRKDPDLKDVAPNPLEKEGWKLYYNDEFNGDALDMEHWSPYYLRHWVDQDERTLADYFFEDGSVVLRCSEDMPSWSSQNGEVKVRALMSYERNHLHKFGEVGSGAVFNRDIPTFDGVATKYGYFEIRMRMPNTRDGSHFAWWMVGTQDDQNSTAWLSSEALPMKGRHSNETGEFDIIETAIGDLKKMKAWRPVIHPNGTTDYKYLWVPESQIPGDPSNEFHIYGFEWDENGTKFYVDNQLVQETDRSPNYRMMTFLSTYATGGMGTDRGIYPKDTYIDYFRIYKKDEAAKPSSVVLNDYATPDYIYVPEQGSNTVQMSAVALDQFDQPIDAVIQWKLSDTIDGFTPTKTESAVLKGVAINPQTGAVTVSSDADLTQDVFVTAYVNDKVKQTYHIKLSKEVGLPQRVLFEQGIDTVAPGSVTAVTAKLYDQYRQAVTYYPVEYQLSTDTTGTQQASIAGVSIDSQGNLHVGEEVAPGTLLIVTAKSAGKYNNQFIRVQ